ncbi:MULTISPECIES: hypothetical protein [unclassified Haematobacter]|uniref:hypothetical protein n=1 Tax=unclassified Haematobacter TaxID=2640585 RepID=UPI0025C63991|nr:MULTISPECIES: hypothetical protein [unclassified Haematobacter]
MLKASFAFLKIENGILYLQDLDRGRSMTNDAEAVVEWAMQRYPKARIAYQDTAGDWGEMLHDGAQFRGFAPFPR